MISVPGGGSSVQCFEIDLKYTPGQDASDEVEAVDPKCDVTAVRSRFLA